MPHKESGPRIVILGAGAIGSYAGAYLARAGHDVTLIDPFYEHIEAIRTNGLTVTEMDAEVVAHVATLHIGEVQRLAAERPVDIAIIAMKSYDTEWATALIARYLATDGYIVSMQNSLNEYRIAALLGEHRVVGCVATFSAELAGPAHVIRGNPRGQAASTFAVGELDGSVTPRLEALAAILNDIDTTSTTTDLLSERWSKLIVNAMRNGISALTGLSVSECDRDPKVRKLAYGIVAEAVDVARRLDIVLKPATGLDLVEVARAGHGDPVAFARVEQRLAANLATRSAGARPSMGQDMIKGRQTEIEFINGFICEQADSHGLSAPLNRALTKRVLELYKGEIAAGPELAYEILGNAPAAVQEL